MGRCSSPSGRGSGVRMPMEPPQRAAGGRGGHGDRPAPGDPRRRSGSPADPWCPMPTPEEVRHQLKDAGFDVKVEQRLPNGYGSQLRLATGQVVNVWDKGTYNVQGSNCQPVQEALDIIWKAPTAPAMQASKTVFVVYGHDQEARNELEAMLRRWGLE